MKKAQFAKESVIAKRHAIRNATEEWVNGFNSIPTSLIEKAYMDSNIDNIHEITPVSKGSWVHINVGKHFGKIGEVIEVAEYDKDKRHAEVKLDNGTQFFISTEYLDVERDGFLPMWGWMWMFGDSADNFWFEEKDGVQLIADCGFRIYEIEEGYIFGIDGAGYDFYESHWIPLYKARGLQWHNAKAE